jgi:hypothetical protein
LVLADGSHLKKKYKASNNISAKTGEISKENSDYEDTEIQAEADMMVDDNSEENINEDIFEYFTTALKSNL